MRRRKISWKKWKKQQLIPDKIMKANEILLKDNKELMNRNKE